MTDNVDKLLRKQLKKRDTIASKIEEFRSAMMHDLGLKSPPSDLRLFAHIVKKDEMHAFTKKAGQNALIKRFLEIGGHDVSDARDDYMVNLHNQEFLDNVDSLKRRFKLGSDEAVKLLVRKPFIADRVNYWHVPSPNSRPDLIKSLISHKRKAKRLRAEIAETCYGTSKWQLENAVHIVKGHAAAEAKIKENEKSVNLGSSIKDCPAPPQSVGAPSIMRARVRYLPKPARAI